MTEEWIIKGRHLGVCNCAFGCPCDFNAPPTHGPCFGLDVMEIDEGHYGELRLDGVRFAALYRWPGPIHEGKGEAQLVVDESATEPQREALMTILSGEDQDPGTLFAIMAAIIDTEYDPLFLPISFEFDMQGRRAKGMIAGVLDVFCQPIRNPITGAELKAQIVLPEGFEYTVAEIASSTAKVTAGLSFDFEGSHAALSTFAYDRNGVVK